VRVMVVGLYRLTTLRVMPSIDTSTWPAQESPHPTHLKLNAETKCPLPKSRQGKVSCLLAASNG
ncbi:MAG TPA: hypothetical protein VFL17_23825, partial [Anaerolineae bacterium]|nr:hypothetical protein [Anaerolineae bacterium]